MKYKVTHEIVAFIDIDDVADLKEKSWEAVSKIMEDAVFGNEGKEEELITRERIN